MTPTLDTIRTQCEGLDEALNREWYLCLSGQKRDLDLEAIYERFPAPATREAFDLVTARLRSADPRSEEHRRLRVLREAVAHYHLDARGKELEQEIERAEAEATVKFPGGKTVPFRTGWVLRDNEPDRGKRQAMEDALSEAVARLTPPREERHRGTHALARELGFPSYVAMIEELSGLDLAALRTLTRPLIHATERIYRGALREALEGAGIRVAPEDVRKHDIGHVFRGSRFDAAFPKDEMVGNVSRFVRNLGLDLTAEGRIRLDLEPRETKSPRAFCSTPVVPDEVYLVIYPHGGPDDWSAFLHELGHALHFGYTRRDIPVEFRRMGDNSLTEGLAILLDHLLLSPRWVSRHTGVAEEPGPYMRFAAFHETYMLRRYAAKLDYELALHEGPDLAGKPDAYARTLTEATAVRYGGEGYLYDVDQHFYCARYLRAWLFQAALTAWLETRYGEGWFGDRAGGNILREIWSHGQTYRPEEILSIYGAPPLDTAPLVRRVERLLA